MACETKQHFGVSTDSSGLLFGTPNKWYENWMKPIKKLGLECQFDGFEVLAWGIGTSAYTEAQYTLAKGKNIPIIGMHGRTGFLARGRLTDPIAYALNQLIIPTKGLIESFWGLTPYLLVHSTEAQNCAVKKCVKEHCQKKLYKSTFYVENDVGISAYEADETAWELSDNGVASGTMADLFHDIKFTTDGFSTDDRFGISLHSLEALISNRLRCCQPLPLGVHMPMGTFGADSFPIEEISDCNLKRLAELLQAFPCQLVIENQQTIQNGQLFSTKAIRKKQADRNELILKRLQDTGIL